MSGPVDDVTRTQVQIQPTGHPPTSSPPTPSSHASNGSHPQFDEGRFLPGALIADRYRVINLLGRGGMGEVYRATDLRLGQPVALKFLPESVSNNPGVLERFYSEVRIARQISHPNVCRVYDIGEIQGQTYLSMEFIDGEDLASLLRRIGRLPSDKATQLARQLCAGLAAAHDKGVLHRDLKPANLMIDGRGQLRIMDFGLAALAGQVAAVDIRSGTPAYMAPEQIAGEDVSSKSDLYSLGLVLYEMFAGRKPFEAASMAELRLKQESSQVSLSTQVSDIDPAVEKVIQRCLDPKPARRPASALAVAAALPGGDPLAAALAAGETPSPELVAAAGDAAGGFSLVWSAACLAVIVAVLLALPWFHSRVTVPAMTDLSLPREVLIQRSRELLRQFGYTHPVDHAYGFRYDTDLIRYMRAQSGKADLKALAGGQPGAVWFWYRESPRHMVNTDVGGDGRVGPYDPPSIYSGMATVHLDTRGRLVRFEAVAPQLDASAPRSVDWNPLLTAAGLDPARLRSVTPKWAHLSGWDERVAWEGSYASSPDVAIRVEAAAWRGLPVYFLIAPPWTTPARQSERVTERPEAIRQAANWILQGLLAIAVAGYVRYNLRRGRGDRAGAMKMGWFTVISMTVAALVGAHHVSSGSEAGVVYVIVCEALFFGAMVWAGYLAVEPPVRRHWPETLISWTRLLSGQFRDPLAGSHLLAGMAAGLIPAVQNHLITMWFVSKREPLTAVSIAALDGPGTALSQLLQLMSVASLLNGLLNFFLLFLFRAFIKRTWLASIAFVLFFAGMNALGSQHKLLAFVLSGTVLCLFVYVTWKFGLLAVVGWTVSQPMTGRFYLSPEISEWYAWSGWFAIGAQFALALWAFHAATSNRRLLPADFLDR